MCDLEEFSETSLKAASPIPSTGVDMKITKMQLKVEPPLWGAIHGWFTLKLPVNIVTSMVKHMVADRSVQTRLWVRLRMSNLFFYLCFH